MMKPIKINTDLDIDSKLGASINDLTDKIIKSYQEQENKIFEDALRNNAVPPIKGELTKGKIKWRGIRLVQSNFSLLAPLERQLFQRNKPISPIVSFDCKINFQ